MATVFSGAWPISLRVSGVGHTHDCRAQFMT